MPYTREMFVKENYPEHYGQFLLGKQEGWQGGLQKGRQEGEQNGLQKGELTGKIQMLQQFLKQPVSPKQELLLKNIDELQNIYNILEKEWQQVQN
ncbi:hypothetical protein MTBBW1_3240002 [Desulfamplus magnetovallimortis]|uniref:DUF4351 domain-containing protein n=1 Tax=Desulfamplus magnetovallimortis TaxID=1246637 RepID=A0A1W1HG28_9BACT|nr:hypothetical protein [Desulfamplus magnetovallimortis]SLM31430.1 hypothetical protein MTBBW1_3240002 [Desulfamplus magnetovallimortis]